MERTLADEGFALGDLLVCLYHSQLMPYKTPHHMCFNIRHLGADECVLQQSQDQQEAAA